MHSSLTPVRAPDQDRLEYRVPALPASGARVSLADRAALRLGLWLLLRSTRVLRRNADHDSHTRRLAAERQRLARESAAAQEQLLWTVRA